MAIPAASTSAVAQDRCRELSSDLELLRANVLELRREVADADRGADYVVNEPSRVIHRILKGPASGLPST
eukprot:1028488-Amphidinium_carterae.1